jgi:hypothetical protein
MSGPRDTLGVAHGTRACLDLYALRFFAYYNVQSRDSLWNSSGFPARCGPWSSCQPPGVLASI